MGSVSTSRGVAPARGEQRSQRGSADSPAVARKEMTAGYCQGVCYCGHGLRLEQDRDKKTTRDGRPPLRPKRPVLSTLIPRIKTGQTRCRLFPGPPPYCQHGDQTVLQRSSFFQIASDLVNESNNRTGECLGPSLFSLGNRSIRRRMDILHPTRARAPEPVLLPTACWACGRCSPSSVLPDTANIGSLRVWADDTASVLLDGSAVGPAANILQDAFCSPGPIGCEPNEFADISLNGLEPGKPYADILPVSGGQRGRSECCTAVLWIRRVRLWPPTHPEPATVMMLGVRLVGLGCFDPETEGVIVCYSIGRLRVYL